MKTRSLKICLFLLLSLTFCSKDSSKEQVQNQEIDNYEFEELGSDAPYIFGQSYNGRNYDEGKKIKLIDAFRALKTLIKFR